MGVEGNKREGREGWKEEGKRTGRLTAQEAVSDTFVNILYSFKRFIHSIKN